MENPKFDFVFLGQSILKYQVPLDIFNSINYIYESNFNNLDAGNFEVITRDANGCVIIGQGSDAATAANYANVIGHNITGTATQRSRIGAGSNYVELDHSTSGNNWANTSDERIKKDNKINPYLDFTSNGSFIGVFKSGLIDFPKSGHSSSKIGSGILSKGFPSASKTLPKSLLPTLIDVLMSLSSTLAPTLMRAPVS